jgi:hypothetical protein
MIEKVRSIAIFGPRINGLWSWPRLYRWAARTASVPPPAAGCQNARTYNDFMTTNRQEITMFRKHTLAMVAAISLSLPAFTLSRAADLHAADLAGQARHRGGWGPRFYNGVPVSYGYGLCYQRELVQTPWGIRWRLVNQCW